MRSIGNRVKIIRTLNLGHIITLSNALCVRYYWIYLDQGNSESGIPIAITVQKYSHDGFAKVFQKCIKLHEYQLTFPLIFSSTIHKRIVQNKKKVEFLK